jgi:CBS domain-containing protein
MRDRDYFDEEYERGRGYRRPVSQEKYPRENYPQREGFQSRSGYPPGYQSPEGYNTPPLKEGFDRERENDRGLNYGYDTEQRDFGYDRFSGQTQAEQRYQARNEPPRNEPPRNEPRYLEPRSPEPRSPEPRSREFAERDRMSWSHTEPTYNRSQLRARDIMTKDVVACHRDTNIREVAKLMRDEDTGALPVIDNDNKVIGIITDRDIVVRALADKDQSFDAFIVNDVMSDEIYSVRPNDRIVDCIKKMGDKQVRRIVVTDDNYRLKGIISLSDVATEAEYDRELSDTIEEICKPKSWFKRLFS